MKVLKGFALTILSLLLGLSLSIFSLLFMLNSTILNPNFITRELDRIDVSTIVEETLSEQASGEEFPEEFRTALVNTIAKFEPIVKEQIGAAINPVYDYLLGRSESIDLALTLKNTFLSPDFIAPLVGEFLDEQFAEQIPPDMQFLTEYLNEAIFPPEMPAQLASALAEAEGMLEQARQYVGYFQLTYKLLIVLMVLLIVGIVFINRLQIKSITRQLGSTFLPIGALSFAGVLVAKYFIGTLIADTGLPSFLQRWLPQFVNNFLAPLQWFSLGILIAGVALTVTSFVYKPREPSL